MTREKIEKKLRMLATCPDCPAGVVDTKNGRTMERRGNAYVWIGVPCSECGALYECKLEGTGK